MLFPGRRWLPGIMRRLHSTAISALKLHRSIYRTIPLGAARFQRCVSLRRQRLCTTPSPVNTSFLGPFRPPDEQQRTQGSLLPLTWGGHRAVPKNAGFLVRAGEAPSDQTKLGGGSRRRVFSIFLYPLLARVVILTPPCLPNLSLFLPLSLSPPPPSSSSVSGTVTESRRQS